MSSPRHPSAASTSLCCRLETSKRPSSSTDDARARALVDLKDRHFAEFETGNLTLK